MTNYYLAREIEKARAKHKPITIVLPPLELVEGQHEAAPERKVEVDAPTLWPDDITVLANVNPGAAARRLLGDDAYDHWTAAGGTAGILFEIVREHSGAASLGESSQS